jgi:RNase P protein component
LFRHGAFHLKAYPLAILRGDPDVPCALDPVPEKKHVDMHLSVMTTIKSTDKRAVVRMAIHRRVKKALELIIVRGAKADAVTEWQRGVGKVQATRMVFDDNEATEMGPKWVLNGRSDPFIIVVRMTINI